jgi:hypothetical protein
LPFCPGIGLQLAVVQSAYVLLQTVKLVEVVEAGVRVDVSAANPIIEATTKAILTRTVSYFVGNLFDDHLLTIVLENWACQVEASRPKSSIDEGRAAES